MGFSERHLGQILSGSGTKPRGERKTIRIFEASVGGSARERLLLDQGRCSAIEGEKCVFERRPRARLVSTSLCSRIVRDRHRDGPIIVEKIVLRLAN